MLDSGPSGAAQSNWNIVEDAMEEVSLDACKRFKDRDAGDKSVEICTIAASTSTGKGTKVYDLLAQCATDKHHFFYAKDADALQEAFETIAKKATSLRLTQ